MTAGQTTAVTRPDYGRLHLVGWSDLVRNEAGVPTMVEGGLTTADEVNTVLAAGRPTCACSTPGPTPGPTPPGGVEDIPGSGLQRFLAPRRGRLRARCPRGPGSSTARTPGPSTTATPRLCSWPRSTRPPSPAAASARPGRPGVLLDGVVLLDLPADGTVLGGGGAAVGAGNLLDAAGGVAGRVAWGRVGADGAALQGRDAAHGAALDLALADRARPVAVPGTCSTMSSPQPPVSAAAARPPGRRRGWPPSGPARAGRRDGRRARARRRTGRGRPGRPGPPGPPRPGGHRGRRRPPPTATGRGRWPRDPAALLGDRWRRLGHVRRGPGLVLVQGLGHVLGREGVRAGQHVDRADQHLVPGRGGRLGVHRVVVKALAEAAVDLELVHHRGGVLLGQGGGHVRLLGGGHGPEQDHVVVAGATSIRSSPTRVDTRSRSRICSSTSGSM